MRITAGKYRGRKIAAPTGKVTRPALSRVRVALLDALGPWIEGGALLDLFCGSGGFLLEALSRGGRSALGVDLDRVAVRTIRRNAAQLGVGEPFEVHQRDALAAIPILERRGLRFDVIFVAPPYWQGLQARTLAVLDRHDLLAPRGLIAVQRDRREEPSGEGFTTLALAKERRYGNTVITYYERRGSEGDPGAEDEGDPGAEDEGGAEATPAGGVAPR